MSLLILLLAVSVYSHPLLNFGVSYSKKSSWFTLGFSLGWGAESTVSIVDRSPPISYASRPASFGPEIERDSPVLGYVIMLNAFTQPCNTSTLKPNTGCPSLCPLPKRRPDPTESWLALVQRGSCDFASKAREAQRLGARALIVGGRDPAETGMPDVLVNMYSPEYTGDISIPSTYIRWTDYTSLTKMIQTSNTTHSGLPTLSLLISSDGQGGVWGEWYSPILTFVIILFLPSLLTFITLFIHRIRMRRAEARERAPADFVRTLESRIWGEDDTTDKESSPPSPKSVPLPPSPDLEAGTSGRNLSKPAAVQWSQTTCPICLSSFSAGEQIRILPCQHVFHMDEVDEWLTQRKGVCPICKVDVVKGRTPEEPEETGPTETTPLLGTRTQTTQRESQFRGWRVRDWNWWRRPGGGSTPE